MSGTYGGYSSSRKYTGRASSSTGYSSSSYSMSYSSYSGIGTSSSTSSFSGLGSATSNYSGIGSTTSNYSSLGIGSSGAGSSSYSSSGQGSLGTSEKRSSFERSPRSGYGLDQRYASTPVDFGASSSTTRLSSGLTSGTGYESPRERDPTPRGYSSESSTRSYGSDRYSKGYDSDTRSPRGYNTNLTTSPRSVVSDKSRSPEEISSATYSSLQTESLNTNTKTYQYVERKSLTNASVSCHSGLDTSGIYVSDPIDREGRVNYAVGSTNSLNQKNRSSSSSEQILKSFSIENEDKTKTTEVTETVSKSSFGNAVNYENSSTEKSDLKISLDLNNTDEGSDLVDTSISYDADKSVSYGTDKSEGDLVDTEKRDDSDKDSDDTDELLNSTVESFSEHAWDPYQDPPYQVVTSDDNEEKLDDSHLTWENEDNFEFDDDYIKDSGMFSAEFLSAMQPKQSTVDSALDGMATSAASNGYPSPSGYSGDSSRVDDSDSDMEDFQHVINESAKQIQVTETSLKKQRRDAMDTGLCMDPSKYAELVATCETNLRCLQVIIEHLNAGKSLVGLTEEDINRVHEIMTCWKDLHNLAVDKQSKSRQLSAIHHEMQMVHKYLRDLENGLEQSNFDDIKAVEERIKYLQEAKLSISEQKSTLTSVDMRVSEFAEQNTDINMLRFKKECTAMCSRFKDIETRTLTRTAELQNLLLAWYDYSETSKELDYLLSQQRQHIQLMQAGQQILVMNEQEKAEAAIDLKNMLIELDGYEAKMASIRQLSSQLLPLCSTDTQTDIRASVGTLSNQLDALKHDCKRMVASLQASETTVDRIEENMEISPEAEVFVVGAEGLEAVGASDDVGLRQRKMEVDSEIESAVAADVPMETEEVVRESIPVASATVAAESSKVRPVSRWIGRLAFCRRILKVAIPLQILLILLFGLAMLLEPDCCEYFNNFRLTFAPQLRYVRGPPPI